MSYDSLIGQKFEGRYMILYVIGSGGMSTVYGAYDQSTGRPVAIKMMKKKLQNNAKQIKLFANEFTALSLLSHPNIVQVYNTAVANGTKYIVMEYVEGITLKKHMDHRGALPEREVIYYATQTLSALEYIHSKGIVHCDIKPQNIILLNNGKIKVADFGIARLYPMLDRSNEKSDVALGTVYYVSPEQAQGKVPEAQSDIYSLGIMLYEAMTYRLPFFHENADEVAKMQINTEPIPPSAYRPDMSVGMEQIILRALEKNPKKRYSSAQEMLTDIRALRQNEKIVFGNGKKSSRYRVVDRNLYENFSNVSNRTIIPLSEKGRRFANNQNAFNKDSDIVPERPIPTKAPTKPINTDQNKSIEISSGGAKNTNTPERKKVPDTNAHPQSPSAKSKKRLGFSLAYKDILSILIGIIASLVLVILLSLGIWFIIAPSNTTLDIPEYSITETETDILWNTSHTEKF